MQEVYLKHIYLQIWFNQFERFRHGDFIHKGCHGNHKVHHWQPEKSRQNKRIKEED